MTSHDPKVRHLARTVHGREWLRLQCGELEVVIDVMEHSPGIIQVVDQWSDTYCPRRWTRSRKGRSNRAVAGLAVAAAPDPLGMYLLRLRL